MSGRALTYVADVSGTDGDAEVRKSTLWTPYWEAVLLPDNFQRVFAKCLKEFGVPDGNPCYRRESSRLNRNCKDLLGSRMYR